MNLELDINFVEANIEGQPAKLTENKQTFYENDESNEANQTNKTGVMF